VPLDTDERLSRLDHGRRMTSRVDVKLPSLTTHGAPPIHRPGTVTKSHQADRAPTKPAFRLLFGRRVWPSLEAWEPVESQ